MLVVRTLSTLRLTPGEWAIAPGRFEGLHLGHQAVLTHLVAVGRQQRARTLILNVVDEGETRLGCLRQRLNAFAKYGVDAVALLRMSEASALETVVADTDVRASAWIIGADRTAQLESVTARRNVGLEQVPIVVQDGRAVSSAIVRVAVERNDLPRTSRLLGRPYAVGAHVIHGFHRGRQLGFRTANMRFRNMQLPPDGVYAVRFQLAGHTYNGVANIGFNPTFVGKVRTLETHVLDFDAEVYGQYAEVTFVAHLRGEQKFPNIKALIAQIQVDCGEARRLLS